MIKTKNVILDGSRINSFESLHDEMKFIFGLPQHYGRNLDALVDCLSYLDDASCNQSRHWLLGQNESMVLSVKFSSVLKAGYPEIFDAVIEVVIDVNERYASSNSHTRIMLNFE